LVQPSVAAEDAFPTKEAAIHEHGGLAVPVGHGDPAVDEVASAPLDGDVVDVCDLEGMADKLRRGGRVADVGCGHGASVVVLADAFPRAEVIGFDYHAPSIDTARDRAAEAGVADRTAFAVADA
jgi:2-polyprenyl-3-methyl-5-hydroxy-6-metoxy-1,4-benzoquinol methylase